MIYQEAELPSDLNRKYISQQYIKEKKNESKIISKENLRQMQMYQKKRQNCRNLRKP